MKALWFIGIIMLAGLAFGVYQVEYKVREFRSELEDVNDQILASEEDIHVLNAEWVYLNRPDRLKELASTHLQMQNVSYAQVKNMNTIPSRTAVAAVKARPAKSVAASLAYVSPQDGAE